MRRSPGLHPQSGQRKGKALRRAQLAFLIGETEVSLAKGDQPNARHPDLRVPFIFRSDGRQMRVSLRHPVVANRRRHLLTDMAWLASHFFTVREQIGAAIRHGTPAGRDLSRGPWIGDDNRRVGHQATGGIVTEATHLASRLGGNGIREDRGHCGA